MDENRGAAHRGLVKALGDEIALEELATPTATTLGFFEVLAKQLGETARVQLGKVEPERFELVIAW